MSFISFSDEINKVLRDIHLRREEIKQEFTKAWLATVVPDKDLNPEFLIKNVRLVEQWSEDRLKVFWHLELKKDLPNPHQSDLHSPNTKSSGA